MTTGTLTRELDQHLSGNPASPLFARLAEALIREGELSRAERLCEKGLELYPSYSTGQLIYARCLAARGRYDGALDALDDVLARYPGNITLWQLQEEWRGLAGEEHDPVPNDAAQFTELPVDAPESSPVVAIEAEVVVAEPVATIDAADTGSTGGGSDELLSEAEVPAPMPVPSINGRPVPLLQPIPTSWIPGGFIQDGRIVSRTLAEIYASQGAIGEAIETYRLLINKMPERKEMLEGRLRELEDRLRNDTGGRRNGAE